MIEDATIEDHKKAVCDVCKRPIGMSPAVRVTEIFECNNGDERAGKIFWFHQTCANHPIH